MTAIADVDPGDRGYGDPLEIPELACGAMAGSKPFVAGPAHQEPLGFPGQLVEDWQQKAVMRLGELVDGSRALRTYLDSCVKCGACTDKCHYFLGTGDPKNMPVARQDLLRKVYRRYFTWGGKYLPWLVGAEDLTQDVLDDWYSYFHQCSQCRRCSVFCPFGIDTAEFSMAARDIMDSIGKGQKYSNEIIGKVFKIGNNLGLPSKALKATLAGLEEEIEEETGVSVRLPLDEPGADILLVTPSADFFASPHMEGLIGYAKVLHESGVSWTFSSYASEAANFGMFVGSYDNMQKVALRIRKAAEDLHVKRLVFGECGHAWRIAYSFLDTIAGPLDFLDRSYPVPQHICEFTWDLIKQDKLRFDKSKNDHIRLTYHDSCNVARASRMGDKPGGQFEIPRAVLRAACNHFLRHGAGHNSREDAMLRRRRRPAHGRTARYPHKGRATAHARFARSRRRTRGDAHGGDLRNLQGAVFEDLAEIWLRHGIDRQRSPDGFECDHPDRLRAGRRVESKTGC